MIKLDKIKSKKIENIGRNFSENSLVVRFLSKNNLAFHKNNEKIYEEDNGNFSGITEMIDEFDPITTHSMYSTEENHYHYHRQSSKWNYTLFVGEIKIVIIRKVREAKYFAVTLDCPPNTSYEEQTSLIIWYINVWINPIKVEELFLGFLKVEGTLD